MNSQLNVHYQPNFQANYVIKGSAREIVELKKLLKNSPGHNNVFCRDLIPEYTKDQPYMETLYSTAEDRFHLRDYSRRKRSNCCIITTEWYLPPHSSDNMRSHELKHVVTVRKNEKPNLDESFQAVKDGKKDFADFMIEAYNNARAELVNILGKQKADAIKIFEVKDVLKAIKEKKFDFISGEINK